LIGPENENINVAVLLLSLIEVAFKSCTYTLFCVAPWPN